MNNIGQSQVFDLSALRYASLAFAAFAMFSLPVSGRIWRWYGANGCRISVVRCSRGYGLLRFSLAISGARHSDPGRTASLGDPPGARHVATGTGIAH
jgi:hypothetical protein